MRFYLDEHIETETVEFLRKRRHNVFHAVTDGGHRRRGDRFHFAEARIQRRILVTCDRDFESEREHPARKHPGVIILELGVPPSAASANAILRKLFSIVRTNRQMHERKIIASHEGFITITLRGRRRDPWPKRHR